MLGIPGDVVRGRRPARSPPCGLAAGRRRAGTLAAAAADRRTSRSARWCVTRLGDEVVDRLVDPLLGGVYAGRADELVAARHDARAGAPRWPRAARWSARPGGRRRRAARPGAAGVRLAAPAGSARLRRALAAAGAFAGSHRRRPSAPIRRTARRVRARPSGRCRDRAKLSSRRGGRRHPGREGGAAVARRRPGCGRRAAPASRARAWRSSRSPSRDVALPGGQRVAGRRQRAAGRQGADVRRPEVAACDAGGLTLLRASVGPARRGAASCSATTRSWSALVRRELRALLGIAAEPVDALVTRWGGGAAAVRARARRAGGPGPGGGRPGARAGRLRRGVRRRRHPGLHRAPAQPRPEQVLAALPGRGQ